MSTSCLETTVVNTSGERRYFDFLPVSGLYLEPNQEFSAPGDITEWVRRKGPGGIREKLYLSLKYAFDQGWMEIKSSPAPIYFDSVSGNSSSLGITNQKLTAADPCYVDGGTSVDLVTFPSTTTGA